MALDLSSSDVARGALRACLVAFALGACATLELRGFFAWTPSAPIATSIYVGLLALPASLAEAHLSRRPFASGWRCLAVVPLVLLVALAAVVLAGAQAIYTAGVVSTGTLAGGMDALSEEGVALRRRVEDTDLYVFHFALGMAAGVAAPLTAGVLAAPLRVALGREPGDAGAVVGSWAALYALALLVATITVSSVIGTWSPFPDEGPSRASRYAPTVAMYVLTNGLPALVVFPCAWRLGSLVLPRRPVVFSAP